MIVAVVVESVHVNAIECFKASVAAIPSVQLPFLARTREMVGVVIMLFLAHCSLLQ
jgi:hypothetical protein